MLATWVGAFICVFFNKLKLEFGLFIGSHCNFLATVFWTIWVKILHRFLVSWFNLVDCSVTNYLWLIFIFHSFNPSCSRIIFLNSNWFGLLSSFLLGTFRIKSILLSSFSSSQNLSCLNLLFFIDIVFWKCFFFLVF